MNLAWYFEFFSGRQPDPAWRASVYPVTGWFVILLVVLLAYYFYFLLKPTRVNRRNWIVFCVLCAVVSLFVGFLVVANSQPRGASPMFFIASLFQGPLVFFLSSLFLKIRSSNGRYVPMQKP